MAEGRHELDSPFLWVAGHFSRNPFSKSNLFLAGPLPLTARINEGEKAKYIKQHFSGSTMSSFSDKLERVSEDSRRE